MRRFVCLAVLLFFTIPFGASMIGCGRKSAPTVYCSSGDSGPVVGQVATIVISQSLATIGESISYGQIGQSLSASAFDCKNNSVSVSTYTYATSNMAIADINPATGQVCAGTWNRHTGGGVPDYTYCTAPTTPPTTFTAYVTASAAGAVSNPVPVYIHPLVTSIAIGNPTPTASCSTSTDPSSNCCSFNTSLQPNIPAYDGASCVSQNQTVQLAARVYAGGTATSQGTNITCQVGHLAFSPQGATNVVTIDQSTGLATANQPGSATIAATIANSGSGSTAGYYSTCPPASIVLAAPNSTSTSINVPLNNAQPLTATVLDTNNRPITGLSLEFNSTAPQIIPPGAGTVTPAFPGTATITAVCQPGACNPSPFSQIGLYGNGKPVTSNGITITASGTSSSVIYAGSTSSQYLYPLDFTTNQPPSLVKLPYVPNSMVISLDGSTIYLGSSSGLMTYGTASNSVGSVNTAVPGTVLAISPDSSTLVVTDPSRGTISLIGSTGTVDSTYGGVATSAQWSPDSQTVYITAGKQYLVHSAFNGWSDINTGTGVTYSDVAITVPHEGAYFAGAGTDTEGVSYCENSTVVAGNPPTVNNQFYPAADISAAATQHITATTDGKHVLGATASTTPATLDDIAVSLPTQVVNGQTTAAACPMPGQTPVAPGYFKSTFTTHPLTGVTATAVNKVVSASNSSVAFVTYNGTSGLLPLYVPSTGTLSFVPLSGGATSAPVSGVFSTDNLTFYAGTSGDNKIHLILINGTTATDSSTLTPNLPDVNGNIVAPNLIVQKPKRATS